MITRLASSLAFMAWLALPVGAQWAPFQASGGISTTPPTPDVECVLATGVAIGTGSGGAGTCSTPTGSPCNGVQDDANIFASFNNWAVNTWQMAHSGLIQLTLPANGTCTAITSGTGTNGQNFGRGIHRFQVVGSNTKMSDNNAMGQGFNFGTPGIVNDSTYKSTFATISAGATSITISDTSKCSLFAADDWTLIGGVNIIDQNGYPPTLAFYEYIQINSVASCAGSGVITFKTATRYGYKSTWPAFFTVSTEAANNSGPATIYALDQRWVTTQAFYNLIVDQGSTNPSSTHTNSNGQHISWYNVSTPSGNLFGPIPSQNMTWSLINGSFPDVNMEVDKIVETVTITNLTAHRIIFQSGNNPQNWTCNSCVLDILSGNVGNTTYNGGSIDSFQVGSNATGLGGSFTANGTAIMGLFRGGSSQSHIENLGIWSSGTLTIPRNLSAASAADNGMGKIRITVNNAGGTAGWADGVGTFGPGGNCDGFSVVDVIDSTHIDLTDLSYTGTCSGIFGNLPPNIGTGGWAVPGGYVYFSGSKPGLGPILQVNDLSSGANGEMIITFNNANGTPYTGVFPTMPGTTWTVTTHPSPSWLCSGCTGDMNVLDITDRPRGPFGSNASRVVTAANNTESGITPLMLFGALVDLSVTVTAACSGASNWDLGAGGVDYMILGSSSLPAWNPTVNAATASGTPRVITPTGSSGAQTGDSLATPGSGAWLMFDQQVMRYSNVGNCGSASTTVTIRTDQGIP